MIRIIKKNPTSEVSRVDYNLLNLIINERSKIVGTSHFVTVPAIMFYKALTLFKKWESSLTLCSNQHTMCDCSPSLRSNQHTMSD